MIFSTLDIFLGVCYNKYVVILKEGRIMLIDFHTHSFPEKIASRAIDKLSFASGGLIPNTDGTVEGLKKSMADNSVDISVVLNIATSAEQQKNVNDFAASINNENDIFSFGSVFPGADDAFDELERIKSLGMKGVKLHPDYQRFSVDDPKLKPLYRKISSLGLITVFHAGFDFGFPPPYGATPEKLAKALLCFDSPVVAAHWGGVSCGEGVLKYLAGSDIYFDTSFGYGTMPRYTALKIVEMHGVDKILFGTDTPWHTPKMELRLLDTLNLTKEQTNLITHENAMKLLDIKS